MTEPADATAQDNLVESTDNGPEQGAPVPPQDPDWDPNAGLDLE